MYWVYILVFFSTNINNNNNNKLLYFVAGELIFLLIIKSKYVLTRKKMHDTETTEWQSFQKLAF